MRKKKQTMLPSSHLIPPCALSKPRQGRLSTGFGNPCLLLLRPGVQQNFHKKSGKVSNSNLDDLKAVIPSILWHKGDILRTLLLAQPSVSDCCQERRPLVLVSFLILAGDGSNGFSGPSYGQWWLVSLSKTPRRPF